MKFPTQNILTYQTGSIGTNLTQLTSGTVSGYLNLPKDLSALNRRGYASTDRKGVPWVFRCRLDYYLQDEDMNGVSAAVGTDFASSLDVYGVQNNWTVRNAAVKWHAARENMYRRAGIPKKDRGAYAGAIRYNYDGNADTWLVPIDGDGNPFTGGVWDATNIITAADAAVALKLVGLGLDEESGAAATALNISHSYLMSRGQMLSDTNPEIEETPADLSILRGLLADDEPSGTRIDDINAEARDEHDNPPYELIDISDSGDVNHDITEPVFLGRALASLGAGFGSCVVDIPFGIADMNASVHDAAGTSVTTSGLVMVTVLDIYPMQG